MRMKKTAEQKTGQMKDGVDAARSQVEELHDRSVGPWNKLEEVFQGRVVRALHRLGVPNQDDIQSLFRQVELLDRTIQDLSRATEAEAKTRKTRVGKDADPVAPSKIAGSV